VSKDQIKAQLSKRKGDVFVSFAHLSHIYSIPYKQYSELYFEEIDNGVRINIDGNESPFSIKAENLT
jgi:hypothetical protein